MIARLLVSSDFERVLRTKTRAQSPHFAIHHVCDRPMPPRAHRTNMVPPELSTGAAPAMDAVVDGLVAQAREAKPGDVWFGAVVPKRHAKRSVTRSLIKRQIRAAARSNEGALAQGLWVIRLRAPFDPALFISAASDALKHAARDELAQVIAIAAQRVARR